MLDNGYYYLAATRLALFRSSSDWAMTIETFGYSPRSLIPDTWIYTVASRLSRCLKEANFVSAKAFHAYLRRHVYDESHAIFPIEEGAWQDRDNSDFVTPGENPLVLRKETLLTPEPAEYLQQGIRLASAPLVHVFELCRYLAAVRRDQCLATPLERREHVPEELDQILQLEEWHHPDLAGDETPGASEAFKQLADVLESGDLSSYKPILPPNTHWAHWPEGGTL
jgi:hypothetical protein